MSWSFSIPPTSIEDFSEAAHKAIDEAAANIRQYNPDGLEAAGLALQAVINLVDEGVVGTGKVRASLAGHGNPNHVAPAGWSKDFVTIQIYREDA